MRLIDFIVVHTAGAYDVARKRVVYQTMEQIRDYHRQHNGWHDIGYHWVIEEDGRLVAGRDEVVIGAHAGGFNQHSLGVCVAGHGDFAEFKPAQLGVLVKLCARKCEQYKLSAERVVGHRETALHGGPPVAKTCPGLLIDMKEMRRLIGDMLDSEVA